MVSLSKKKIKVLLLEGIHANAVDYFKNSGYSNIEYRKEALEEKELIKTIKDAHIVGIRSRTQINKNILEVAQKLIAIGNFCIGTNQVDLEEAKKRGIPVFNAPYSNTRSVAELVISEIVMLLRGIPQKNAKAHQGVWQKNAENSFELRGKKLGIVGYGHIGSQVSVLAEALGMQVFYFDIQAKLNLGNSIPCSSLEELLGKVDVITLHVPATEQTKWMIGQGEISKMKKGSYLLNASRGNVVVIEALALALKEGRILGAAIDVFPQEPKSKDDEFISELREFENVILTPHIGGSTQEAQKNIAFEVAEKLVSYSDIGTTSGAVNFPEVQLPPNSQKRRFLHVHENTPGIMEKINKVFADKKLNVSAQFLQTAGNIGYVVMGIDGKIENDKEVLEQLKSIKGTIRARILY